VKVYNIERLSKHSEIVLLTIIAYVNDACKVFVFRCHVICATIMLAQGFTVDQCKNNQSTSEQYKSSRGMLCELVVV